MSSNDPKKKKSTRNLSRRNFIGKVGTATAAFTIIPRNVMPGKGYLQPSDTVNVAGIGIGARGASNLRGLCDPDVPIVTPQRTSTGQPLSKEELEARAARQGQGQGPGQGQRPQQGGQPPQGVQAQQQQRPQQERVPVKLANIYALCDVDTEFAAHIFKGYPKAKVYTDWRRMLEKEKSSIDAVMIGTPDHNHAPIAAAFMREKKHIYVEKPLCKTIFECRKLAEIAKENNVVTQMGNQGHASEGARLINEWIQSGAIGLVREVHLSTNRPIWPQGNIPRPAAIPVPKSLNWDVWLGPAPEKAYHPDICHFNWRGLRDYGTGALGDMGAHIYDHAFWSLNLGIPTRLQASSSVFNNEFWPLAEMITYEFPARGYMPPVKVTWFDGGLRAPRPAEMDQGVRVNSALFLGDKGVLMHGDYGSNPQLVPKKAMEEFVPPKPWLERSPGIYAEWIDAIRNNKKSSTDFSYASRLVETMMLGNIAVLMAGRNMTLEYDPDKMQFTNLPEANNFLHYEYRKGWSL
ncbi:MAG: Gfo/Idh/MocA family oxidoreductase [Bacteroidales bacterium]|nr:Gfo/Idh/MocA family oxidoreductase [Bacteroidales bacterium]